MNDPQNPVAPSQPSLIRRWVLFVCLGVTLYVVSYAVNSLSGGYWGQLERDARDLYTFDLSMHTATLWQPLVGYWSPYRSDWVGKLYSPLIRLDRQFVHKTRYAGDPDFHIWIRTSKVTEWHPQFRAELAA